MFQLKPTVSSKNWTGYSIEC